MLNYSQLKYSYIYGCSIREAKPYLKYSTKLILVEKHANKTNTVIKYMYPASFKQQCTQQDLNSNRVKQCCVVCCDRNKSLPAAACAE